MAHVLQDFSFAKASTSHPWDEWLDGRVHLLVKGEDYTCTTDSIRVNAYARGKHRNVGVVTKVFPPDSTVSGISMPLGGIALQAVCAA